MIMINKENTKHYKWGSNCDSWVFHDNKNLSVKLESMPPNTSEVLHYHNDAQQFFYILNGEATFHLNNEVTKVKSNEGIAVLPQEKHFIKNELSTNLDFLVISQPNADSDRIIFKNS